MRPRWRRWCLAFSLVVLTLVACRQASRPPAAAASTDPGWEALTATMTTMHSSMSAVRRSGRGDVDFVSLMLPHHEAAVAMARAELLYGSDPQMRRLAQEIITDQQSEIALMQLWLTRRGKEVRP
jgi:uncharacterized protein (DUF305 family)